MASKRVGSKNMAMPVEGDEESAEDASIVPGLEDLSSIFVVGDIHFQKDAFVQGEELIEKMIEVAKDASPSMIVLLGDILDNHETVRNSQYKQAERLIDELRVIAPVYVLIGNHDLINQSQFLTDAHFFGPFKKWEGVTIVDIPLGVTLRSGDRDLSIVMCPYVPPGRFVEALNTLFEYEEPIDWQLADCIFGHQEIKGVTYNGRESGKGDVWDEDYPPLILGHIHEPCHLSQNVWYVGSARQVASNETPDKRVWNITFDEEGIQHDEIDLGLKARKEIEIAYENVKSFDFGLVDRYHVKLKIRGTREQFKLFRKSQLHARLVHRGVKIAFDPVIESTSMLFNLAEALKDDVSFEHILRELIKKKSEAVQEIYEEMYGSEELGDGDVYELVFVDS
jgi:DNA repair exonuclease SbcCD nuclease subunit